MLLWLLSGPAFSQPGTSGEATTAPPAVLAVSLYKTTHLIFPYAIRSVDRGSADVLAQPAASVENVLRVKAGKANFRETNLTVITVDGALYDFVVRYTENPAVLTVRLPVMGSAAEPGAHIAAAGANEAVIRQHAAAVACKVAESRGPREQKHGLHLRLAGTYILGDVMFYQLRIRNRSSISYDTDQLRFYMRDRKRSKRTAFQELELTPLHVHGSPARIAGYSEKVVVYALPKVTVPDQKYLFVQLLEKHGGRHLKLKLPNRVLLRSKVLTPSHGQVTE